MKTELTPNNWFRFGNVINTKDGPAIYCIELSTFPETHMLTKFKSDSFVNIPKTIQNMGWKYEKVIGFTKKSGSVSRVETENYIIYLDEEKRVEAPKAHEFIDNAPECDISDYDSRADIRSEYSDVYRYLNTKRLSICGKPDCQCSKCFWAGITINPSCIPECTVCKNDTKKVSVKVNSGVKKVDIEPDCCRACIWWNWFHEIRKTTVGCKCEDSCNCGKLKYSKKETVIAKMEKLEIKDLRGKK